MYYSKSSNSFYPEELKDRYKKSGNWPSDIIKASHQEWIDYGLGSPPKGHRRGADEEGRPSWVPLPPLDTNSLAALKRQEIDTARDEAFTKGLPYEIAGEQDIVQTRPQDQINLLGLSAKAQRLIAAGKGDTIMTFRGQSNVNHKLTAEEMDVLSLAALEHIEGIYQHSWARKDDIDTAMRERNRAKIDRISW